jgi:carbon catabolite-derepressing protein kinase
MSCFAEDYHSRTMKCRCCLQRLVVSTHFFRFLTHLIPTTLFWATEGQYHLPNYLSPSARSLITSMLAVDPVKRITIPEIIAHPFFQTDLPRYLQPLPPKPGPVLGTLSSLVSPPVHPMPINVEVIEGLGRVEEDVVADLAGRLQGVTKEDIYECLRRDDGIQGNAVKVAYMLLRDKRRLGNDCGYSFSKSLIYVLD